MKNKNCAHCDKKINFDPYVKGTAWTETINGKTVTKAGTGDSYYGCWCDRWWCSKECAKKDGWVFRGDAYETDHVSCNHCRKEKNGHN